MRAQIQHLPSFSPLLLSVSFSSPSPSIIKIFRSFSLSSRTSAIIQHHSIQKYRLQQQQTFITPAITRPGSYTTTTATRTIRTIQRKYGVTSAAAGYTKNSNWNTLRRTLVPASSTLTVPVVTPSPWRLKFESRIPSLQQYQHQQWPRPCYFSTTTSISTDTSSDDDPNKEEVEEEEEQHTRDQPGEEESNTNSSLSTASAASLSSPSSSESSSSSSSSASSASSSSKSSSSSSAPILYVVTAEVHDMVQYKEWLQELEILLQDTLGIEDVKIQHFENPQSSPEYTTKTTRTSTLSTVVTTFPSSACRQRWEDCPERQLWLDRGYRKDISTLVSRTMVELEHELLYSYLRQSSTFTGGDGTSTTPSSVAVPPPPRWRMALVLVSASYPTVIVLQKFIIPFLVIPLFPAFVEQPFAVKLCASIMMTVTSVTYFSLPIMMQVLGPYMLDMQHTTHQDGTTNWQQILINGTVLSVTYASIFEIALCLTDGSGILHDTVMKLLEQL